MAEEAAVVVVGRVNWREDKMALIGPHLAALDDDPEPPLVLELTLGAADEDAVLELRSVLQAYRGLTPVRIVLCNGPRRTTLAVDDYPVAVSPALIGELRSVPGIRVVP